VALLPRPRSRRPRPAAPALSATGSSPAPSDPLGRTGRRGLSGPPRRWEPSLPSCSRSKRSPSPSMQRNTKAIVQGQGSAKGIKPRPNDSPWWRGNISPRTAWRVAGRTMLSALLATVVQLARSWVEIKVLAVSCPPQHSRRQAALNRAGARVNDGPSVGMVQAPAERRPWRLNGLQEGRRAQAMQTVLAAVATTHPGGPPRQRQCRARSPATLP